MAIIQLVVLASIVIGMLFIFLTQRERKDMKRPGRDFQPKWSSGRSRAQRRRIKLRR